VRNEKGFYEDAAPTLTTSGDVSDFIRDRTAAWTQHLQRQRQRRTEAGR
jgi:phospholipase C